MIDGTENFTSGIPFFGSGVAILIDEVPSVAAVYVPVHSVVYTAVLPGPRENPADGASATQWDTISGNCVDLVRPEAADAQRPNNREKVAVHFTRSNGEKRRELIAKVDAICQVFGGLYALNAGLPAMVSVATGAFGAFVNNWTNPWDVAAGEVLVRACGGQVSQLDGSPIPYDHHGKISVLASRNKKIHAKLLALMNN